MTPKGIDALGNLPERTGRMPLLFIGHGNPMHALAQNDFTRGWQEAGHSVPKPAAVLCISAHWETKGTRVTAMQAPRTIHDFSGFPRELFAVEYPAPGSPALAEESQRSAKPATVELDHRWGLDHGCWSVVRHLYPDADVPVVQLSLDSGKPPQGHYDLARELSALRTRGVLILGSGNIVHNLRLADWDAQGGFDWALAADARLKDLISRNEHRALINYAHISAEMQLAVPTAEHYLPLLYILGLKTEEEQVSFFNVRTELGSISMTSLRIS